MTDETSGLMQSNVGSDTGNKNHNGQTNTMIQPSYYQGHVMEEDNDDEDDEDREYGVWDTMYRNKGLVFSIVALCTLVCSIFVYFIVSVMVNTGNFTLPVLTTYRHVGINESYNGHLVFIGDIHGEYYYLKQLVKKIDKKYGSSSSSSSSSSSVVEAQKQFKYVLLGDFITKGKYSLEVVQWMQEHDNDVECVLGNHEVTTMSYKKGKKLNVPFDTDLQFKANFNPIKRTHKQLYSKLGFTNLRYLAEKCSAMIHFTDSVLEKLEDADVTSVPGYTHNVVAAHAGVLPNALVDPEGNPPNVSSLLAMKFVDETNWNRTTATRMKTGIKGNPTKDKKLVHWWELWTDKSLLKHGYSEYLNTYVEQSVGFENNEMLDTQEEKKTQNKSKNKNKKKNDKISKDKSLEKYTVVYGHAAAQGLNLHKRTKGIDSNCVSGGKLSAWVVKVVDGVFVSAEIISVDCN